MEQDEYVLVFMGYGHLENQILSHPDIGQKIFLMPAVKPEEVTGYVASADVEVCFEKRQLEYDFCLPNKLFECIFAGIPVIVNESPEMGALVKNIKWASRSMN